MTHENPHDRAADAVREGRPVEAQYTRQGRPGVRILWLLIISAGAAAVLLIGMWMLSQGGFSQTNANTGHQAVDAAAFQGDDQNPPAASVPTTPEGQPRPVETGEAPNVNAPVVRR